MSQAKSREGTHIFPAERSLAGSTEDVSYTMASREQYSLLGGPRSHVDTAGGCYQVKCY